VKYYSDLKYQLAEDHFHAITDIRIIPINDIETKFVNLSATGKLVIKAGFAWDGPSGPTRDTKSNMRAALVHDAIYYLIRQEMIPHSSWRYADQEFELICKEDNMNSFRLWYYMIGLNAANGRAALPKNKRKVHEIK